VLLQRWVDEQEELMFQARTSLDVLVHWNCFHFNLLHCRPRSAWSAFACLPVP